MSVPRFLPLPEPLADPLLDLRELLRQVHARMGRIEASIERVSFVIHDPGSDLLCTYLCHDRRQHGAVFEARSLHALPGLAALPRRREARVVDDLAADAAALPAHVRWLLARGWRSSLTLPLLRGEQLLGFLFVNASQPAVFTPARLEALQPLLDLLLLRIGDHLASLADLRATLALVAEMVALRDPFTGVHQARVGRYSALIGRQLQLPPADVERLALFATLHDLGKVGIPDRVLLKPGPLDPEEQRLMHTHVVIGLSLIERVLEAVHLSRDPSVQLLREVVAQHHEALDGSGYPLGLEGSAVSLAARIVAVADIYDSLTQERPYKQAMADQEAAAILREMVGSGRLDGRCVEALLGCAEERAAIRTAVSCSAA